MKYDTKKKAKERVNKYLKLFEDDTGHWNMLCAKYCALAENDEILNVLNGYWNQDCKINNTKIGYYEEVKKEIEKL